MNTSTQALTAREPNSLPVVRQTSREVCHTRPAAQRLKQKADRVFEARLRWFLALARAA